MYIHKKTNKTKKRKQTKKSRKLIKKHTKKQTKYLGGNDVYTPTSSEEMKQTILFYNNNKWNDEKMKNLPQYKGPISSWNVSNIKDMSRMFSFGNLCPFNQPLNEWDVSNVENMSGMFQGCFLFNQPLNNWNVSNVKNMSQMFEGCYKFNQPLDNWDVSKVKNMFRMFYNCGSFDQPLEKWNVSNVTDMSKMFYECKDLSKNLDSWTTKLDNVEDLYGIFDFCKKFDKEHFIRKLYQETFETVDETYKSFSGNDILKFIQIYNKHKKNVTICDAIYLYNDIYNQYINGILRNNQEFIQKLNPKLLELFKKIIYTLDDYFTSKNADKSTKGMKVYRGEKKLCENDTCRVGIMSSYTSTSKDISMARTFAGADCCLYTYELEEGIPYIDIDDIMEKDKQKIKCDTELKLINAGESEIILPRGIILKKVREEDVKTEYGYSKYQKNFVISISYDENYIKNNPINF